MTILVTGAAGFIGSELCLKLLHDGQKVVGIDNHNDYYDPKLKEARLARHADCQNYTHLRLDISNYEAVEKVFLDFKPQRVINLAAQAGVRYSIENPFAYVNTNIVGFMNILECCKQNEIKHLIYASSSSVYGGNEKMPFSEIDNVDRPLSLYAASKKSNELLAHSYSSLFKLPTTGLRFFTVYGPWGRPDMALFKFTQAMLKGEVIKLFNHGAHSRDFTYVDDIVDGIIRVLSMSVEGFEKTNRNEESQNSKYVPWRVYNIGNGKPQNLMDFVNLLESELGVRAKLEMAPLQPGDVPSTHSEISKLREQFCYQPQVEIKEGIHRFVKWYRNFYEGNSKC